MLGLWFRQGNPWALSHAPARRTHARSAGAALIAFSGAQLQGQGAAAAAYPGSVFDLNLNTHYTFAVAPATVPGHATGVSAIAFDSSAEVSWTAPESDGGSVVTAYTVTSSPGSKTCATDSATSTSCVVDGLDNGTEYSFTVVATNSVGDGDVSVPSSSVTPVTNPGAPTGASATAGNASASVSWTAPSSTGGASITAYTVTSSPGGKTCTTNGAGRSCSVTALANGRSYTFTVVATNSVGKGSASAASSPVTPKWVPRP
ncbi:MAG: fibronectin type III domain-containing protein [Solirubrobacterales bacterium]|nr:fibronectin type III domain-containing protein [Solirubrobacterales bacterium]